MQKTMGVKTMVGLCIPGSGDAFVLTSEFDRKDASEGMVIGYYKGRRYSWSR